MHMSTWALGDLKRAQDPPGLELQVAASHSTCLLGTESAHLLDQYNWCS